MDKSEQRATGQNLLYDLQVFSTLIEKIRNLGVRRGSNPGVRLSCDSCHDFDMCARGSSRHRVTTSGSARPWVNSPRVKSPIYFVQIYFIMFLFSSMG